MDAADAALRHSGLGVLAALPDHLISYITFLLDVEDVIRLGCCSKLLRVFACEEPLWLGLCLKQQEGAVEYKANWRQTALLGYAAKAVPQQALEAAARPLPPLQGLSSIFLYKRWYRGHVDLRSFTPPPGAETVQRLHARGMAPADFAAAYDATCMPVLLGGLMADWPVASWQLPALCTAFPAAHFKVSKPHGGRALMTLPAYTDYMARQADEEPLYVFDPSFVDSAPGLRQLYDIPAVFDQDYMSYLLASRPSYRWLVLGPARAGASWHVDPALTTAWNALLSGRKRWALYPPHTPPPGVLLEDDGEEASPDDGLTSLQWFLEVYPTLPPERRPIEFVQEPGDVVFVPGGWWHCVLNLDTAVAVTQNYVSDANLERVVSYMAYGSSAYHADALPYYDAAREAGAWAARWPHAVQPPGSEGSGGEEEEEEEEEEAEGHRGPAQEERSRQRSAGAAGAAPATKRVRRRGSRAPRADAGDAMEVDVASSSCEQGGGGGGAVIAVRAVPLDGASSGGADRGSGTCADCCGAPASCVHVTAAGSSGGAAASEPSGTGGGTYGGSNGDGGGGARGREYRWHSELGPAEVAVWRRTRALGRWLRRLWEHEPRTRPTIQGCLDRHLHGTFWRQVLSAIAAQHGGAFTRTGDAAAASASGSSASAAAAAAAVGSAEGEGAGALLPLVGADAFVFLRGESAVKVFTHEMPTMRALMCALECHVPARLLIAATAAAAAPGAPPAAAQAADMLAALLPQPVACGAVTIRVTPTAADEEATAAEEDEAAAAGGAARDGIAAPQGGQDGGGDGGGGGRDADGKPELELSYLVARQLRGSHVLTELWDALSTRRRREVAEALGCLVGRMHAAAGAEAAAAESAARAGDAHAPAPAPAAVAGAATQVTAPDTRDWLRLLSTRAVWHDRFFRIWVSGLGVWTEQGWKADDADTPAAPAAPSQEEAHAEAPQAQPRCEVPVSSAWWPFVQHLRTRRRDRLAELAAPELPAWVKATLPDYLPHDPASLLGFRPRAEAAHADAAADHAPGGPGVPPLLLHGDLSATNVMMGFAQPQQQPAALAPGAGLADEDVLGPLGVVDFADGGHGDPLYELAPLMVSCFMCCRTDMEAFWASYKQHTDLARLWPQAGGGADGVAAAGQARGGLAYRAMVYCLLHEEGEVCVQRGVAAAAAAGGQGELSSLEELAAAMWGFLDEP